MNLHFVSKAAFALLLAGLSCSAATASEQQEQNPPSALNWRPWSDHAFVHAKQQKKLVLLNITAKWCSFCKKMDAVTYQNPDVINTLQQNFVIVRAEEAISPTLIEQYKNEARPTTVIFDSDGKEIIKRSGYLKPQWMNWMLLAVVQNPVAEAHK